MDDVPRTPRIRVTTAIIAVLTVAILVLVSGCAQQLGRQVATGDEVGSCPPGIETDTGPLTLLLGTETSAFSTAADLEIVDEGTPDTTAGAGGAVVARLSNLAVLRATSNGREVPTTITVGSAAAEQASELAAGGAQLIVHTQPASGSAPPAFLAAALPDGSLQFIGECADATATDPFAAVVATANSHGDPRSASELFEAMVMDPHGPEAQLLNNEVEPLGWEELDAAERSLDPEETPTSVLAGLSKFSIVIEMPESWRESTVRICTRTSLGWNECVLPSGVPAGAPMVLTGYYESREPVDVMLLGGDRFTSPSGVVATLSPDQLQQETVKLVGSNTASLEGALQDPNIRIFAA